MEIEGDCLDELLFKAYDVVLRSGTPTKGTRADAKELIGVTLRLARPRARLSRSGDRGLPFSAIGELLWYLTGGDDVEFVAPYIPSYRKEVDSAGRINGAYGPRLFSAYGLNQIEAATSLLRAKPETKRAVIQIYAATDFQAEREVPCTTTLQFLLRGGRLNLVASLRSNDAYLGLPHDAFCFTMLQEMMAVRLGVELGAYIQMVGSFHLYDKHAERAARYMDEGHQAVAEMPAMPAADPLSLTPRLLEVESLIRRGDDVGDLLAHLDDYWSDLMRLVQVHFLSDDDGRLNEISAAFSHAPYRMYLEDRRGRTPPGRAQFEAESALR